MRILHVIPFFTPEMGGSAQVANQMARHLGERGHHVTVLTSDYGMRRSSFAPGPFEVVALRTAIAGWGFYVTPGLPRWAARNLSRFDIIHLHEMRTFHNAVVSRFALRRGIPYVLSAHGTLPVIVQRQAAKRIYDRLAGRSLLDSATRLIAVSNAEVEQYRRAGIEAQRVRVVHNGLDLTEFAELPAPGRFRRRFPSLGLETRMVLYLGRLHRRKGIDHLIEAFAQVHAQLGDSILVIAGPDDGDLARLRALSTRVGLQDRILFTGPLYGQDKLAAMVDADVLASPGEHEIFGLVPFEALMCGTPVIVCDDCGSGQLIGEANAGYVVAYGDVSGLKSSLLCALSNSQESSTMAARGREFVRGALESTTLGRKHEEVYAESVAMAARQTRGMAILAASDGCRENDPPGSEQLR